MKKFHIIFLVLLGLLLTPTAGFACGKNSKHSCKKEASQNQNDNCCENGKHSGNGHSGCGGKCGHSSCDCASVCGSGITFTREIDLQKRIVSSYSQKQKFYESEITTSSGFFSLWLIPKIS